MRWNGNNAYLMPSTPAVIGRSDYARNAGDPSNIGLGWWQPQPSSNSDPYPRASAVTDTQWSSYCFPAGGHSDGVTCHNPCKMADITAASNTYMVGERYCWPDHYYDGLDPADDQGWTEGYDWDTDRWVSVPPMQDTPGLQNPYPFGSTMPSVATWRFAMVRCSR